MTITPEQEAASVRMMLELGIPAAEVAEWTSNARKRREAMARGDDALRHNYTYRTEAERSERDKLAEPAKAKWERALQPTDARRCGCGAEMYEETTEPSSMDYCCEPIAPYWVCPDCGEQTLALQPTDTVCGRLMVGRGSDTYDPMCQLPHGHEGSCRAVDDDDQHRSPAQP